MDVIFQQGKVRFMFGSGRQGVLCLTNNDRKTNLLAPTRCEDDYEQLSMRVIVEQASDELLY